MKIPSCAGRASSPNDPFTARQERAIRQGLLLWFKRYARTLLWRGKKSPYAIWVAEVMLQQTQVARVIPYYQRFIRALPNVERLAEAPLEKVLELWSGLGYYRRARNLHLAARTLVQQFGGRIPRDYRQLRSLPGIGDYTACAILSIAFNSPYAALDGNVARVVARLRALAGSFSQPAFRHDVRRELDHLFSPRQSGDFNQALMELGQTVCLPRAPRCPGCPVRKWCRAYQRGNPVAYPAPRPRRATLHPCLAVAVIRRDSRLAMARGLEEGLLDDLWNFPAAFGASHPEAHARLEKRLSTLVCGSVVIREPLAELRHSITHRQIRVRVLPVDLSGGLDANSVRWFSIAQLERAAVSQLTRKIAQKIKEV